MVTDEFFCYHYFYVPNPCVREFSRSKCKSRNPDKNQLKDSTICDCNVLFKTDSKELFMLFNPSQIEDPYELTPSEKNSLHIGILNMTIDGQDSKPFSEHSYSNLGSFRTLYKINSECSKIIDGI